MERHRMVDIGYHVKCDHRQALRPPTESPLTVGDSIITAKMHSTSSDALLAACDTDILGKSFKMGELKLELHEDFYGSMQVEEDTFRNMLSGCTIANLCGELVVGIAVEMGLIDEDNVLVIDGVPHAQFAKM